MRNHPIIINPSLLSADFLDLEKSVRDAASSGARMLHADVMDGVYVPNISFGFDIIEKIVSVSSVPVDVHMMTVAPWKYLDELKNAGAYSVTIHSDVGDVCTRRDALARIRSLGMRAAVALKPAHPAGDVADVIDLCDMILVMTVEPGFGGQKFMEDMIPKIRDVKRIAAQAGVDVSVQVDGGINADNIGLCAAAGADNFVVGTAFFSAADKKERYGKLRAAAEKGASREARD
ncbi:MAG: ribulose-phosphate 3-epimerase [Clostridia bacterium]|nr:ribulose-phosphate 3-epimerase [Clostridia bacterium]